MTVEELNVKLTADIEDLRSQMDQANAQMQRFGQVSSNSASTAFAGFKKLASGLAALGVAKFVKDCNSAYITQMSNELKLSTVMKQRLGATEAEVQAIKTLASEQQKIGVIGDEVQLAGAQQLATYAKQRSTIETLLPAMNNLMAQQNGYNSTASDAVSIANLFGKALQGQTSALTRVGITFTEAQENVLKYGDEAQRAAMLAKVITDNVGNMNEALRNTPTGELTALANDFSDLKEQIGATFQPLISSVIPALSQALYDVQPIVSGLATGFSTVASVLNSLDPTLRQTILYIGAASVAISVLNRTVGTTASGLILLGTLLTWLIGKFSQANDESAKVTQGAFIGASGAANKAKDSTDKLTNSIKEAGKAAGGLAAFDEITTLSGGSSDTIASQIATEEDIDNINGAADAAARLAGMDISLPEIDVPTLDWDSLIAGVEKVGGQIWNALFGNDDEKYAALKELNRYVETIFGPEFTDHFQKVGANMYDAFNSTTDKTLGTFRALNEFVIGLFGDDFSTFWQGVGSDIYTIFNGSADESYKAMVDLNEKLKVIPFWESISPFFQKVGASLQGIATAFDYLTKGDMEGVTVALAQAGASVGLIDQQKAAELADAYYTMQFGDATEANIAQDKILKEEQNWLSEAYKFTPRGIIDQFTGGKPGDNDFFQLGVKLAEMEKESESSTHTSSNGGHEGGGGRGRGKAIDEYEYTAQTPISISTGSATADYYMQQGMANAANAASSSNFTDPPATAEEMYNAVTTGIENSEINVNVENTTTVELDGDKVGEAYSAYRNRMVRVTDGFYGG